MKNGTHTRLFLSGLLLLGSAAFLSFVVLHGQARASFFGNADKQPSETVASFSGFNPGTSITGRVIGAGAQPYIHEAQIDQNGGTDIPAPPVAASGGALSYDFSVAGDDQRLNVLLKYNPGSDDFSLSGSGAEPLSRIVLETAEGSIETRSDWAGLFEEDRIKARGQNETQPFQIAFYGGVMNDGRPERVSPYIIKVQTVTTIPGALYQVPVTMNYLTPLTLMAKQFSIIMMQQVLAIGQMIDAKDQLEAQRLIQTLKAEALKDYHPSEQLCRFGSFTRSLASTEAKADFEQLALSRTLMTYYRNQEGSASQTGDTSSMPATIGQYKQANCDPADNNGGAPCGTGAAAATRRMNSEASYLSSIEIPYTLDVDFTDGANSAEEEDILSLAKNLYWAKPFSQVVGLKDNDTAHPYDPEKARKINYMQARRMMAVANLAHNSFTTIVGMKSKAANPTIANPGWAHMKTMMREFGLSDADIEQSVGANPSYYAQMDFLSKRIFQSPNFYTNLLDKPANVDRINASLGAIKLMQMRDHYDASLRREMLVSGVLEEELISAAHLLQGRTLDQGRKKK
jgi:hypothetical protein